MQLSRNARSHRNLSSHCRRLAFDVLERRELLAVTFTPNGSQLRVDATNNDDNLEVSADATTLYVDDGTSTQSNTLSGFTSLRINGKAGDDVIRIVPSTHMESLSVTLDGGSGDDVLVGGSGDEILRGQTGNDILIGGGGSDNLFGGPTTKLVPIPADDDVVIGGFTSYDADIGDLQALRNAWDPSNPSELIPGEEGDAVRLNAGYTVFGDGSIDTYHRTLGKDQFIVYLRDATTNATTDQLVDAIVDDCKDTSCLAPDLHHIPIGDEGSDNFFKLVKYGDVTHVAVADGDWSDSSIWKNSSGSSGVPSTGSRVLIPSGQTVTVDTSITQNIGSIRVDGELNFSTTANSKLIVDTLIVPPIGTLFVGQQGSPIPSNRTATVEFKEGLHTGETGVWGPLRKGWDPTRLSLGLVSRGHVEIVGADKTDRAKISSMANVAGKTVITLDAAPSGWQVGDRLVITGVEAGGEEVRTIHSINGTQVTLSGALLTHSDHTAPAYTGVFGQTYTPDVWVGNLTRNVVFQTDASVTGSTTSDIEKHGHTMFASPNTRIENARFERLGRTNKSINLDDFTLDDNLTKLASNLDEGAENRRARYSVHFHRVGGLESVAADGDIGSRDKAIVDRATPIYVKGSVVEDDPGWGFVNHSSNVIFRDNVTYDVFGSGFVTEAGDELGAFIDNLAVRSEGSTDGLLDRNVHQDFGHGGHGFWLQSTALIVKGNVAAGHAAEGLVYYPLGLIEPDLLDDTSNGKLVPRTAFDGDNLKQPNYTGGSEEAAIYANMPDFGPNGDFGTTGYDPPNFNWSTPTDILVTQVPLFEFDGNEVYGSLKGVLILYLRSRNDDLSGGINAADIKHLNKIQNLDLWNIQQTGLNLGYNLNVKVTDARILSTAVDDGGYVGSVSGVTRSDSTQNITMDNIHVQGFDTGVKMPNRGIHNVLKNSKLDNRDDNILVELADGTEGERKILIEDITFAGPTNRNDINMSMKLASYHNDVTDLNEDDEVLYKESAASVARQLYFAQQHLNFAGDIFVEDGGERGMFDDLGKHKTLTFPSWTDYGNKTVSDLAGHPTYFAFGNKLVVTGTPSIGIDFGIVTTEENAPSQFGETSFTNEIFSGFRLRGLIDNEPM